MRSSYSIQQAGAAVELRADFDSPDWADAPQLDIGHFHLQSSDHHPQTQAKLLYDRDALHAIFRVRDRYVKSVCTNYEEMVCTDSCVELFIQPRPDGGYFNLELNCGGTMLLYYIEDATYVDGAFRKFVKVSPEDAATIQIATTMPKTTPVEIVEPIEWLLALRIPFAMMERYVGTIGDVSGQIWRGNLYKCADHTSHPHWASWSPIGEMLNFHQPEKFGDFRFE